MEFQEIFKILIDNCLSIYYLEILSAIFLEEKVVLLGYRTDVLEIMKISGFICISI